MKSKTWIKNGHIVLPNTVIKGQIVIEEGRIAEIVEGGFQKTSVLPEDQVIDAQDCYIMPGIIDMHCDALEKEMQPRPNTLFPVHMAFFELEKKLATSGITTMYHSLTLSDEWGVREQGMVVNIIQKINQYKKQRAMINHKIHLRYEVTFLEGIKILEKMIREKQIDFMSYMDHTPGQGQFRDKAAYKDFVKAYGVDEEKELEAFFDKSVESQQKINWNKLISLAKSAGKNGIHLASHDDDTKDKIETLVACEGVISEFPINLEIAEYAMSKGMSVCVGAPNIIRGKSHSNNMRAIDAINHHAADIICSDYLPSAIVPAIFHLAQEKVKLTEAVKMATLNPAKVLGIDHNVGTLEAGKYADLIVIKLHEGYPIIRQTMVGGKIVYQSDYFEMNDERVDSVC
ncbi:alpha-D-ribose 1-methylphosphonate 5-triphosphate diphosphatase [Desulfitobacterium sp. AusDCA]|uniref:alpha-D-ribose 1-methylphosphonate 5-triphosphate diphosphatase n=1 Tax=Desulfitobacterium sp. AusDCA TaxID=3240383 RepID=UPI003DA75CCE